MFYTTCLSNPQNLHKQRIIPTSCRIPPESLKMQEDDARKGGILFVYRGFRLLEGGFGISGYFRIFSDFLPKCFTHVLQVFRCFTLDTEKVRLKGLETVEK
jgi:hypothetical protein